MRQYIVTKLKSKNIFMVHLTLLESSSKSNKKAHRKARYTNGLWWMLMNSDYRAICRCRNGRRWS